MSEHPILFNGEMVRAILENRKCQTRRAVKPQIMDWTTNPAGVLWPARCSKKGLTELRPCPYGVPGDRLWVRETWREVGSAMMADNSIPMDPCECRYRADDPTDGPWRSPIHMPRWASRLTLEVTGVRVERVQDVTDESAVAEGVCGLCVFTGYEKIGGPCFGDDGWSDCTAPGEPVSLFRKLWDSINAKRGYSWDSNPWVWVVEFKNAEDEQ